VLVVLDTNILISALLFRGAASAVHQAVLDGRLMPLISPPILEEYRRVLSYEKFGLSHTDVRWLLDEEIAPFFRLRHPPMSDTRWIPEDPTDDHFIQLATAESATLISGDRHILQRRQELPCPVMTLSECLSAIEKSPLPR